MQYLISSSRVTHATLTRMQTGLILTRAPFGSSRRSAENSVREKSECDTCQISYVVIFAAEKCPQERFLEK